MSQTDFNDLHLSAGLDVVKAQVMAVVNRGVPAANDAPDTSPSPTEPVAPTVEQLLSRYALAMPDAKVWDAHKKQLIKQHAFKAFIGPRLFKQWLEHDQRRTVDQSVVSQESRAAQVTGGTGVGRALRRYVYLYPTDSVWDRDKQAIVPISGLRYAIADYFDEWLKHPHREEIDRDKLIFDPTQKVGDGYINTFRGLPLEPVSDESRCKAIRALVGVLCNKDVDVCMWLLRWMALPLQQVGTKMATAVLMHSDVHGSGKSLLWDGIMRPIYGEYGATLGQHQLESQYTDWRSEKLFGLFEEVLSRDQKYSHSGTIKHMITGATHRVEKKFISGWEEANYMNAVFLSNEVQPFPLEESDRRFMVIWPETKLDEQLLADVVEEIENGGVEAFYHYLLSLDLSGFGPHTKPITTDAKERLIDFGRAGWDTFVREWERDALDVPFMTCLASDLYRVYDRWCSRMGERSVSATKFSGFVATRVRRRRDLHYSLGIDKAKGTFFIVGKPPADVSQQQWLGDCVSKFRQKSAKEENLP
jgi:putative DNA primase/helicase